MKTFILILATSICGFGAVGDYTVLDNLTLVIEDPSGNKIVAGHVRDHIKIRAAKVQSAVDAKLAALADSAPLAARPLIESAKAQGATIVKATEDKVKAAEEVKAAADLAAKEAAEATAPK
jgi:hypothetical protein